MLSSSARAPFKVPLVLGALFLMPLGVSGTAIALPGISTELSAGPTALSWVVNAFNVAFAALAIPAGLAADRWGYRKVFLGGMVLHLASNVVCWLAPSPELLVTGRLFAGAAGAAVTAGGAAMIASSSAPGPVRSRRFAWFGTSLGLGLAFGPSFSGLLVTLVGWRGLFAAFAAIVVVMAALALLLLPNEVAQPTSSIVLDLSLLRNRRFIAFALVPVAPAVGFVTVLNYLPVGLSAVHGLSPAQAGALMLAMTLPVLLAPSLAALAVNRLSRVGSRAVIVTSFAVLALGDVGLLLMRPGVSPGWLVPALALIGLGYGLSLGLVDGQAIAAVPETSSGAAAGVLNFLRLGGAAIVLAVYGLVMARLIATRLPGDVGRDVATGSHGHGEVYASSLHVVALAMAALVAVVAILFTRLHRNTHP